MVFLQSKQHHVAEWVKYLAIALMCGLVAIDGISSALADSGKAQVQQTGVSENKHNEGSETDLRLVIGSGTVASRLGGYPGILAFLHNFAVPALLADSEIASFFGNLTQTPAEIEQCLAMMLDHDLGGSSRHSGATLESGHRCRGSMPKIHQGRNIPDEVITKFIGIVSQQAELAGVSQFDTKAIAKVLERNRPGVRNK
ncbi:hypothetical protein [Nitrosomonas sp.]|uniref:hypothetical protein n=1 Tax=Nitrosomonas sp. TaxID=42353 RepID=UPI0025CD3F8C|nr:hypothetical protein [Nitrosomonas sp.]